MKPECLAKLCAEINDLYSKVRKAAQDEFRPALNEVICILRDEIPDVEAVQWLQEQVHDTVLIRRVEFKFEENDFEHSIARIAEQHSLLDQQAKILKGISTVLMSLNDSAELAFGSDVRVTLDIRTGKLKISDIEG